MIGINSTNDFNAFPKFNVVLGNVASIAAVSFFMFTNGR